MISIFGMRSPRPTILFYNTLTKKKEPFRPVSDRRVGMYTCGPTVYDYAQIGNLRSYVFSDIIKRVLEYHGYEVKHIINFTDVGHLVGDLDQGEDKMTAGLLREGLPLTLENMKALGEKYAQAFIDDLKTLNIELPFAFPRASDHIKEQIAYISALLDKGYAYKATDGIYFDVARFPNYGALGGSASVEHSRIGVKLEKHDPRDFTLWKFDASMGYESPWGKGYPGWHIECTAMSTKYLGKTFDIHTGGIDHIPVHHNNEIAQTEAATGKQFVKHWMHGAFLTIEGKRIGKSEGNAIRLTQLIERGINPLAFRYFLLGAHYRSPINFTWTALEAAQTALYRLNRAFADFPQGGAISNKYRDEFIAAIRDDADMPRALAILHAVSKDDTLLPEDRRATMADFDRVLGLRLGETQGTMSKVSVLEETETPEEVRRIVDERESARKAGDYTRADRLRDELAGMGYELEDTPTGPKVRGGGVVE